MSPIDSRAWLNVRVLEGHPYADGPVHVATSADFRDRALVELAVARQLLSDVGQPGLIQPLEGDFTWCRCVRDREAPKLPGLAASSKGAGGDLLEDD